MTTLVSLPASPGDGLGGLSGSSSRERDEREEVGRDSLDPSLACLAGSLSTERVLDGRDVLGTL